MKVSELIEELQKLNQNAVVILQKDAEGNGYSPLSGLEESGYVEETSWYCEVTPKVLTDDLKESGWTEEDINEDGEDCVVLWPIN